MTDSRLFKIIYYLLEKGRATAPELASQFEVSIRTIYRDLDTLSSSGIPIYTQTGRNGGIHILHNSILDKVLLSENEKQELLTTLQSILATGNTQNQEILTKLSALFCMNVSDWMEVDFSRWNKQSHDNAKFESIKYAILHHQKAKITYAGSNGMQTMRTIQPYKLIYKSQSWYLNAFCEEKQDYRIFKFNRILSFELLNETFIVQSNIPDAHDNTKNTTCLDESNNAKVHPSEVSIVLRFCSQVAYRVYDEFDESQIQHLENGDMLVTADMPVDDWLLGYLLSFGTQVNVIEPVQIGQLIAKKAKEIYEKYETLT